jgi:putative holliday junction resolvase
MNVLGDKKPEERVAPSAESRRILAIDYGRKRIGLALSDELGLTAQPLAVLVRKNRATDLKRLREICVENSVGRIIVGHPVHITGEAGEMAEEAARFAARLTKALHIETEMVDERLTSWEARQTLSETKSRAAGKRATVDDVAAVILLRDFLEHRREAAVSTAERY